MPTMDEVLQVLCATCSGAERDHVDAGVRCARCHRLLARYIAAPPAPVASVPPWFTTRREAEAFATAQGPGWGVWPLWGDRPEGSWPR